MGKSSQVLRLKLLRNKTNPKKTDIPVLEIKVEHEQVAINPRVMDHDFTYQIVQNLAMPKGHNIKGFQLHFNNKQIKLAIWGKGTSE